MYYHLNPNNRGQGFLEPSGGYLPPNFTGGPYPPPGQQQAPIPPGSTGQTQPFGQQLTGQLIPAGQREDSYIENILRINKGKLARIFMTFTGSKEWPDRVFEGIIEAAGRDHIILSDPKDGHRYLLLMVYLDYVEFPEEINYYYFVNGNLVTNITKDQLDPELQGKLGFGLK